MSAAHRSPRRRACAVRAFVSLLAVCIALAASSAAAATDGDRWDPRITDLVRTVEAIRGLDFERPVPVKVASGDKFGALRQASTRTTRRDVQSWEQAQIALQAIGLLDSPVDLDTILAGFEGNILGFYDPKRKVIVVRGNRLRDPAVRATLAHELTHALQDQHFDLRALQKRAVREDSSVVSALVEGDASRVGEQYLAELSSSERAEIDASNRDAAGSSMQIPPVVEVEITGQYALGYQMVSALQAAEGRSAIDDALRDPRFDDLVIIDPVALLDGLDAAEIDAPPLDVGDVAVGDPLEVGAWALYMMLASRLPLPDALAVAERWGGDRTVAFTRGSQPCVRMTMAGRDADADAQALGSALRRWSDALDARADVAVGGETVSFTVCDRPDRADAVSRSTLTRSLLLLVLRNSLVAEQLGVGLPAARAKCFADKVIRLDEITRLLEGIESITDDPPPELLSELRSAIQANAVRFQTECAPNR